MRFRRWLALILLAGLWLSFHGRFETDVEDFHSSPAWHVADVAHEHDDSSSEIPSAPQGDHKDQHGCYHSHAPFVVVKIPFNCQPAMSTLLPDSLQIPGSRFLTSILHPPRA